LPSASIKRYESFYTIGNIQVFDHRPTEDEINKLKSDCGEMYCLRETVSELELNAAPKLFSFDRDY
jgi:hypothetical protein